MASSIVSAVVNLAPSLRISSIRRIGVVRDARRGDADRGDQQDGGAVQDERGVVAVGQAPPDFFAQGVGRVVVEGLGQDDDKDGLVGPGEMIRKGGHRGRLGTHRGAEMIPRGAEKTPASLTGRGTPGYCNRSENVGRRRRRPLQQQGRAACARSCIMRFDGATICRVRPVEGFGAAP